VFFSEHSVVKNVFLFYSRQATTISKHWLSTVTTMAVLYFKI